MSRAITVRESILGNSPAYDDLVRAGRISEGERDALIDAGYVRMTVRSHEAIRHGDVRIDAGSNDCIVDTLYGTKWGYGAMPVEWFLSHWKTHPGRRAPAIAEYSVSSLSEVDAILRERHARFARWLCFRGQPAEYRVKRPVPNPYLADQDGRELLVLPARWRAYVSDFGGRPTGEPSSMLRTLAAHDLVYRGLPPVEVLLERNRRLLGEWHTMSDLEDSPDPDSREYHRRWYLNKIEGFDHSDYPLLEQHYGIATGGLDVTFDLGVAGFFATQRFQRGSDGRAQYAPSTQHEGAVIYAFAFVMPPLAKSSDLVRSIRLFDHVPAVRPLRQQCALAHFGAAECNGAVVELEAVFRLTPDFDRTGVPPVEHLFPSRREDPFYDALLDLRAKYPDAFGEIIEYVD